MAPAKRIPSRRDWPKYLRERDGYFSFDDPIGKRSIKLGRIPLAEAKRQARIGEIWVAKQRDNAGLLDHLDHKKETFGAWLDEYRTIIERDRALTPGTLAAYQSRAKRARAVWGEMPLSDITTQDAATLLENIRKEGKATMARLMRVFLKDVFKMAEANGRIAAGRNPVSLTYSPTLKVKRARLTIESFNAVYAAAAALPPWAQNSMALALVTGQRLGDIAGATFRQDKHSPMWIEGDWLMVNQGKTGNRLKIPLDLTLACVGWSVRDIVGRCRDTVLSKYLVHHVQHSGRVTPGERVSQQYISKMFQVSRSSTDLTWEGNTPPTYHEIRSLSERLYRLQGNVDVQTLLGHKNAKQTEQYDDPRGVEFKEVRVK